MGGYAGRGRVLGPRPGPRGAFAVAVACDELDDVLRLAREHGIEPGAGSGRVG